MGMGSASNPGLWLGKVPGVYEEPAYSLPRRTLFMTGVPVFLGTLKDAHSSAGGGGQSVPTMIRQWSDFGHHFGKPSGPSMLASAVRGFFENGGHCCYVVVLKDRSSESLEAGLQVISNLNTVDIVCTPDWSNAGQDAIDQQQMVVNHCDTMGDRFAILDSRLGDTPHDISSEWSQLDGTNAALYYPWIRVKGFGGRSELVPPCGHIAGVYSRSDYSLGVHKAPANEVLEGVIDLECTLTRHDREKLSFNRVNYLCPFPRKGLLVWGARTLSGQPDWTFVNVRRLFLTIVRWIDCNMQGLTFETNDKKLWAQIERKLIGYLLTHYESGALKGASPREAFYVKCNAETNPYETRTSGQAIAEIGFAPATPFEFISVRLVLGESRVRSLDVTTA